MGYAQTAFVIGISTAINAFLQQWWRRFKQREALKPQPMALRKGVYVPWGPVQKIERFGHVTTIIWCAYILVLIGLAIYLKLLS